MLRVVCNACREPIPRFAAPHCPNCLAVAVTGRPGSLPRPSGGKHAAAGLIQAVLSSISPTPWQVVQDAIRDRHGNFVMLSGVALADQIRDANLRMAAAGPAMYAACHRAIAVLSGEWGMMDRAVASLDARASLLAAVEAVRGEGGGFGPEAA